MLHNGGRRSPRAAVVHVLDGDCRRFSPRLAFSTVWVQYVIVTDAHLDLQWWLDCQKVSAAASALVCAFITVGKQQRLVS